MLEMTIKIFQNAPGGWVIQVSTNPPRLHRPYFFQKEGFASQDEAKAFLIANIRMFSLNMGVA